MKYDSKTPQQIENIRDQVKLLIITATPTETRHLHEQLEPLDVAIIRTYIGNHTYFVGTLGKILVAHVQCAMGSIAAGASTVTAMNAIDYWKPNAVVMIGIAFGKDKKKQKIGDVLISEAVIPYNIQKISKDEIIQRSTIPPSGNILVNRFKSTSTDWEYNIGNRQVNVEFGQMLSGESLVDNEEYRDALLRSYPNAIGGEMEGAGLYAAAYDKKVEWIIVKGICDYADGHKKKNKSEFQKTAAESAISLCKHIFLVESVFGALDIQSHDSTCNFSHEKFVSNDAEINKALFDVYTPDKEVYYLERDSDKAFTGYLKSYSIWVSGTSGCGKTTLILRNLNIQGKKYIFLNFAHCVDFEVFDIFNEMYQKILEQIHPESEVRSFDKIHKLIEGISNLIAGSSLDELVMFIEEIPLPGNRNLLKGFVDQLNSLLTFHRMKFPDFKFQVILSSIDSPREHVSDGSKKVHGFLKFICETNWLEKDIRALLAVLLKKTSLAINPPQAELIILKSKGSPRFVKNFLREFVAAKPATEIQFNQLLNSVAIDLKLDDQDT